MSSNHRNPSDHLFATGTLRRASRLVAAAALLAAGAAAAAPQLQTIEECLETGTRAVSLPAAAGGTLSASTCSGCPTLRLRFDARTVFLVGKQRVNYAKFREAAGKDDLRLDVFYQPQTRVLTRLRIPAASTGE
jgi:cytochrome c5